MDRLKNKIVKRISYIDDITEKYSLYLLIEFRDETCLVFDSLKFIYYDDKEIVKKIKIANWSKIRNRDFLFNSVSITNIKEVEGVGYYIQFSDQTILNIYQHISNLDRWLWITTYQVIEKHEKTYKKMADEISENIVENISLSTNLPISEINIDLEKSKKQKNKKRDRRIFLSTLLFIIILSPIFLLFMGAILMAPGSYVNAERYDFELTTNAMIKKVEELQERYPQYAAKRDSDGIDAQGNFYHFQFYLPDEDAIASCAINVNGTFATIIFIHVSYLNDKSKSGRINTKEVSTKEEKKIKQELETQIFDKLGKWENGHSFLDRFAIKFRKWIS